MNTAFARDLMRHMEWADARVWSVVRTSAATDARTMALLHHLHSVQRAFLAVWQNAPLDENDLAKERDSDGIEGWARDYHRLRETVVDAFDDDALRREASIPWSAAVSRRLKVDVSPVSIGESVLQVAMHSQYHRAQVNTRIRELGADPPLIDYIIWIWLGRPAAPWNE